MERKKKNNIILLFLFFCFSGCSFIPMTLSQAGGTVAGTLLVDKIRNEYSEELGFLKNKKDQNISKSEKEELLKEIEELNKKYSTLLEKLNNDGG